MERFETFSDTTTNADLKLSKADSNLKVNALMDSSFHIALNAQLVWDVTKIFYSSTRFLA